jgi:hypothetical protein
LSSSFTPSKMADPSPYEVFLPGLVVRKADGPIRLSQLASGWLTLEGSVENLRR